MTDKPHPLENKPAPAVLADVGSFLVNIGYQDCAEDSAETVGVFEHHEVADSGLLGVGSGGGALRVVL